MFEHCSIMLKPAGAQNLLYNHICQLCAESDTHKQTETPHCTGCANRMSATTSYITPAAHKVLVLFSWSISGARVVHCTAGNLMSYIHSPWCLKSLVCFSPSVWSQTSYYSKKKPKNNRQIACKEGFSRGFLRWDGCTHSCNTLCEGSHMCYRGERMYSISRTSPEPL